MTNPTQHSSPSIATLLLLALGTALVLGAIPRAAESAGIGDLLVAPTRVVFEGRQRSAELTLVNIGTAPATYRISFVQLRMDEHGGTREIAGPEAGELFADQLIRYSPRQVTLEPNVAQTVRMQLRVPADLAPGEYRSHLLFRAVPTTPAAGEAGEPEVATEELSIQLTPIYGVSIPVIVRHGDTSAQVTMSDLQLQPAAGVDDPAVLQLRVHRTGNRSVHGSFTVTFQPASGGDPTVVGLANGVAVYSPNPTRTVGIQLRPPSGVVVAAGTLRVTYGQPGVRDGELAQGELLVP